MSVSDSGWAPGGPLDGPLGTHETCFRTRANAALCCSQSSYHAFVLKSLKLNHQAQWGETEATGTFRSSLRNCDRLGKVEMGREQSFPKTSV